MLLNLVYSTNQFKNYTVHLICHTHTDIGWLSTLEEYFYKMNEYKMRGQYGGVYFIITTVVDSLLTNRDRKFVYSEFKYFQMWWDLQSEERKE